MAPTTTLPAEFRAALTRAGNQYLAESLRTAGLSSSKAWHPDGLAYLLRYIPESPALDSAQQALDSLRAAVAQMDAACLALAERLET